MRRCIVVAIVLTSVLAPALARATDGSPELTRADVDAALAARRAAGSKLEALTLRFEQAMFDEEVLRERVVALSREVAELEQDIAEQRSSVVDLVIARYVAGGPVGTERIFSARTFTDLPVQAEYLRVLNEADQTALDGLETSEQLQVRRQAALDAALTEQQRLVAELSEMAAELSSALAEADAEYEKVAAAFALQEEERKAREEAERRVREAEERRRAEEERQARATTTTTTRAVTTTTTTVVVTTTTTTVATTEATTTTTVPPTTTTAPTDGESTTTTTAETTTTTTAAPPPATDARTCPVDAANSFSDTWGAARSGGRTHKGVDIFAARNAPLVAIESGTVTRTSNSTLGGISIYLTGVSGARYYYAHMEFIAPGIGGGSSVEVGEVLGGVGTTGNAPSWLPMLHFQYAPAGGDWVNPYPLAKSLCG